MPELTLKLLGGFQLTVDGAPVPLARQTRLQSLLAYLALHPAAPQSRLHLAALFWPDSTEAQARGSLRQALYELRHAAPALEAYLHNDGATLQWRDDGRAEVDALRFARKLTPAAGGALATHVLEEAVALYTGDLLPACYDEWALAERERLRQLYLAALEQLVARRERSRAYDAAVAAAQQLLAADPLQETTYRTLMRLYLHNGDRARALRMYHACVTMLEQELDVPPSAETQAEYQRLLRQEVAPLAEPVLATPPGRAELPLVGRAREWEALQAAWASALQGHLQLVLIGGEAGIGKTRLAEELVHHCERQGYPAARTRSYAAEGRLAYAPVTGWLRAEALRAQLRSLDDLWLAEIARILPELLTARPDLPAPQPLLESWQRQRFREALAYAVAGVARPLLLLIDDLQWCDQETLEWLHYLLRGEQTTRLLVVGTARREEVDAAHPLAEVVINLQREGRLVELDLGPLDATATATLAVEAGGHLLSDAQAAGMHAQSAGIPLFVVEMARAHAGQPDRAPSLPPKVQAVLHARLAQLTPAAYELAKLAAVVGRAFTLDLLAQAGAGDEDALVQSLDELWRRRIVREVEAAHYDFSHDRLRDAAYAEITPVQRRRLHKKLAQALEVVYAGGLEPVLGELGDHYAQAGLVEPAVRWYRQASAAAKRLYAHTEVVSYLVRAVQVVQTNPERARLAEIEIDLLHSIGVARIVTDGWGTEPVGIAWEEALALARQAGTPFQICRSLNVYATFLMNRGELRMSASYYDEALRFAEAHAITDRYLTLGIQDGLIACHFHAGRFASFLELIRAWDALLAAEPAESSYEWWGNQEPAPNLHESMALWHLGYADQARAICRAALEHDASRVNAAERPEIVIGFFIYNWLLINYVPLRDLGQVRVLSKQLIEHSARADYDHSLRVGRVHQGYWLAHDGKAAEGLALVRAGIDAQPKAGLQMFAPYYAALLAETLTLAGEPQQALEVVEEAFAFAASVDNVYWSAHLLRLKGDCLDALDAPAAEVEQWYRAAIDLAQTQGSRMLALRAATALARHLQVQGRGQEAHALLAPLYADFTEGFDTPDLTDARALLAALA